MHTVVRITVQNKRRKILSEYKRAFDLFIETRTLMYADLIYLCLFNLLYNAYNAVFCNVCSEILYNISNKRNFCV